MSDPGTAIAVARFSTDWREDCQRWWGQLLTGVFAHWCECWDELPVDETCLAEFSCCTCWHKEMTDDADVP